MRQSVGSKGASDSTLLQHEDTTQNGRQRLEDIGGNQWLLKALQLSSLSFLRWGRLDLGREAGMRCQIHRSVCHLGARRIFSQEVALVPIHRRSNRSKDEPIAAIWAGITQNVFDAHNAEGTLVGADTRLKQIGRQRLIAMLAGRSQFEHGVFDVMLSLLGNQ